MIQKLYELAKYIPQDWISEYENDYGLFMDEKDVKVLVLSFSLSDNTCEYQGMHLEDYSKENNISKYYYKLPVARLRSDFPTTMYKKNDKIDLAKKSQKSDITEYKSYNDICAILGNCKKYEKKLQPIYEYFLSNANNFCQTIESLLIEKQQLLTININNEFIGESSLFDKVREVAKQNRYQPYFKLSKEDKSNKNKACSVCLKKGVDVSYLSDIYNFYTIKKNIPTIAGGFQKEEAWKNYPICSDCINTLRNAKPVLEEKMSYKLYGIDYFILPSFIHENKEYNQKIMNIFFKREHMGKYSLKNDDRILITNSEKEVFKMLSETENRLCYNLFFYERIKAKFEILASIDEVFPSQLKNVFDAKLEAEKHQVFKNVKSNENYNDLKFNLGVLNEFFPIKTRGQASFEKQFLEITRSIFLQKEVSFPYILNQIMSMIQKKFANNEGILFTTLNSFMLLKFMSYLGIIKQDRKPIKTNKEIIMDEKYQKFFDEHADFFDSNIKKAVFLQGVLCQNLLDVQWDTRKATPFRSRLNGLKLNEKIIKRLLPEIITKLEEYNCNFYRKLETTISELYINSDFDLSNDEISYYFTLGMNLNKKIKSNQEEENDSE